MILGVDILRHLLAVFVILQHMSSSRYTSDVNEELSYYVNFVDGAVACFFIISGYFSKRQEYIIDFIKSQAIRLLVPFFLFSIFYTILLFLLGKGSISAGMYATLSLHGAGMQLYFLPYMFFVSVFFAFFRGFIAEQKWLLFCILISFFLVFMCINLPTVGSSGSDKRLIPFYILAYISGYLFKNVKFKTFPIAMQIIFLFLGLIDERFFDFLGMVLIFYFSIYISKFLGRKRLWGSGCVYLLHTPIVNFSISVILINLGIINISNVFLSIAITYFICILFAFIFIKIFPKQRWLILE